MRGHMNQTRQDIQISAHEVSVTELAQVLLHEIELYESYYTYLQGDTERMVQLKVEELEQSNKAKATILLKIQAAEQGRQKLVDKIVTEKSIAKENVRIHDICETLNTSDREQLFALREKLTAIVQKIRKLQEEASYLVRSSLTWIDGSMASLKQILTPTGVYDARGKVDKPGMYAGHVLENKI